MTDSDSSPRFTERDEPTHALRVEVDDWEFTHPDDCPCIDLGGYWDYDCLLGRLVRYEGFDSSDVAPGDYIATAWAFQSTEQRTYGEWQSGIDLKPASTVTPRDDAASDALPTTASHLR